MLQRKKPLTRKKPLRAKAPMRARKPVRDDSDGVDEAARKLWPLLAARSGPPFVENERIGPYRVDFTCLSARLVILIANSDDPERRDWFASQNWRVLAFAAATIIDTPERVLDAVAAAFTLRVVGN